MRTNQHTRKIWLNAKLQNISYPMLARGILVNCQFLLLLKATFSCEKKRRTCDLNRKMISGNEYMKYQIQNSGWNIRKKNRSLQWCMQLYQLGKKGLSLIIETWKGFGLTTSVIPVPCSTSWAIKPTGTEKTETLKRAEIALKTLQSQRNTT